MLKWTISKHEDMLYLTNGTDTITWGKNTQLARSSLRYELNRRNSGGDPNKIEHSPKTILKLCHWATKRTRHYLYHRLETWQDYDDILSICGSVYTNCIKHYNPYSGNTFTTYYYSSIKRAINEKYFSKIKKLGRPLNQYITNININDKVLMNTAKHTMSSIPNYTEYDKLPLHLLKPNQKKILLKRLTGKTLEEIANEEKITKQRICQIMGTTIKRLQVHYSAYPNYIPTLEM